MAMVLGVISDTHGLLRPEAIAALRGVDAILHAGDIGAPEILDALRALAPVTAVRGNNDREPWGRALPAQVTVTFEGRALCLLHDAHELSTPPAGCAAVVAGHSHKPLAEVRAGVLHFNPGSAGPRRFKLPASVGRLRISATTTEPEILVLAV